MPEPAQYLGTGKRKTSVARVILRPGDGKTWINGKTIEEYFPRADPPRRRARAAKSTELEGQYDLRVRVHGGGPSGQAGAVRHGIARALVEVNPDFRVLLKRAGLPDARRPPGRAQEGRPAQGAQGAPVQQAVKLRFPAWDGPGLADVAMMRTWLRFAWRRGGGTGGARASVSRSRAMARRYFGTDGVRGIVGEFLTADLVERLGRAATLWSGAERVFVGRDTRASGVELEQAFARGVVSAGGIAVLGGVLPTPAVALAGLDLGVVISASHNPPEYNGVKFFDSRGRKLTDAAEEEIEALLDAQPAAEPGEVERVEGRGRRLPRLRARPLRLRPLGGLRIAVDCAQRRLLRARAAGVPSGSARRSHAIGDDAERREHQRRLRRHRHDARGLVTGDGFDLGIAFDGDGDRMLAVDERARSSTATRSSRSSRSTSASTSSRSPR